MAPGEVIDLLSSDDEALLKPRRKNTDIADATAPNRSDFLYLSDDLDNTICFDAEWLVRPSTKRRKLSTPDSSDNVAARPRLPRIKPIGSPKRGLQRDQQNYQSVDEFDPIVFTSSLSAASRAKTQVFGSVSSHGEESDDSLPDDLASFTMRQAKIAPVLSERTAALLDSLSQTAPRPRPSTSRKRSTDLATRKAKMLPQAQVPDLEDNIEKPLKTAGVLVRNSKLTAEEKVVKTLEKERERAARAKEKDNAKAASEEQKAKEKEEDQEKKRKIKEEKAREKRIAADLAEVNRLRLDKKDSTPEMIVDLPASIDGQSVDTQIREFLKNLGVDTTLYQSPIPNVIRWRRKMKARWSARLDHWEPIDGMEIREEQHIMLLSSAKDFVALVMAQQEDRDLETHVAMIKSAYTGCIPIYMVEGLHNWLRKNKTAENRAYQAKVLSQAHAQENSSASQPAASKRKKCTAEVVDEDMIENALLRLQVMHGCLVHHTHTSVETAEWVANFTQHISTIPYRLQRMNLDASFCMESGQVKTGEDKDDTFIKMLQEVVRITPSIAYGIAAEHPSVISLIKAFRKHGRDVLEDLQKAANRNGAPADRRIGPAISRRLYKVFTELDQASTDV